MRNLLIFISKYNALFLFLIFEIISLFVYINYNSFPKAKYFNYSSEVTGALRNHGNQLKEYLRLKEINDSIAMENAKLRNQLKSSFYVDTAIKHLVIDTVYRQQYSFITAKVINNSVTQEANYITINRGSRQGVAKNMGVICSSGIVGIVIAVSPHFSLVMSLLNKDSHISAMLKKTKELGNFQWGDDLDPHKGILKDISNTARPELGEEVVTSEYSLFPTGIPIGKLSDLNTRQGGYMLNMEVSLAVNFSTLQNVYVVINKLSQGHSISPP
jgi:rod shape-determining protein MreC